MDTAPDIGKIISLIMENPKIIDEIRNLASESGEASEERAEAAAADSAESEPAISRIASGKDAYSRRKKLLYALKPYVSGERARAIDTMLSLSEAMDALRGR